MKRITVILATLMLFVAVGVGQKGSTKSAKQSAKHVGAVVRIKGHVMGETVAEFVAIEPTSKKQLDNCNPHNCTVWGTASDDVNQLTWTFKEGVLVSLGMTIRGAIYPNVRDDLTKKFGFKPMESTIHQQNVYGARWNLTSSFWINDPKVSGMLENDENPSQPMLTFVLSLKSAVETVKTTNPLD